MSVSPRKTTLKTCAHIYTQLVKEPRLSTWEIIETKVWLLKHVFVRSVPDLHNYLEPQMLPCPQETPVTCSVKGEE